MPTIAKRYFWIVFIILLAACAPEATTATPIPPMDLTAIYKKAVTTVMAQMTQIAAPTETPAPTPYPTGTITRTPWPTLTPLPFETLEGLRAAYIIKGNLYVQDSGGQPMQLTHSGQDTTPILSDDGQKIIFFRGPQRKQKSVYVINPDGSGEQELVIGKLLSDLGLGYDKSTQLGHRAFFPGTHRLLFQTYQTNLASVATIPGSGTKANEDLLLLDMDSGKIKRILPPGQASYFQVSPDGKLAWILSADHLDLIGLDGKSRRRLTDYPPALPDNGIVSPDMYWSQNSRKLSLVLPPLKSALYYGGPEPKTIWQYSLDSGRSAEIHFDPPPVDAISISPDGNWVAYTYCCAEEKTDTPYGMYIGNLRTGATQFIDVKQVKDYPAAYGYPSYHWNPDNIHLILTDMFGGMYVGNIYGDITPLDTGGFLSWIDENRYINGSVVMGKIGEKEQVLVVDLPTSLRYMTPEYFTFVFVKPKAQTQK